MREEESWEGNRGEKTMRTYVGVETIFYSGLFS